MATNAYTLKGGSDRLQLTPGGKEYVKGDAVPLTKAQLRSLKRAGLRFAEPEAETPVAKQDKPA